MNRLAWLHLWVVVLLVTLKATNTITATSAAQTYVVLFVAYASHRIGYLEGIQAALREINRGQEAVPGVHVSYFVLALLALVPPVQFGLIQLLTAVKVYCLLGIFLTLYGHGNLRGVSDVFNSHFDYLVGTPRP